MMRCAASADDIWLTAMAIPHGTKRVRASTGHQFINVPNSQETALWRGNVLDGKNDATIAAVFNKYGIYRKLRQG